MKLPEREKQLLKGMIERGEPLPPKYRLMLFLDTLEVELIHQGRTSEVTNLNVGERNLVDEAKAGTARAPWVPVVNNHGCLDRQALAEIKNHWDAANTVRDLFVERSH